MLDKLIIGRDWADSALKLLLNTKITEEDLFAVFYTAKLLIKSGAKINLDLIVRRFTDTSLSSTIIFIITAKNINQKYNSETLLMSSCKTNNCLLAKLLIKNGANLNVKDESGSTCLDIICSSDEYEENVDLAKLLIESGAEINTQDEYGFTPLISSIIFCNTNISTLLINYNANLDIESYNGNTALTESIINMDSDFYEKKLSIIKMLLSKNASIKSKDCAIAILLDEQEIIETLKTNGANIGIKEKLLYYFYKLKLYFY